MLKSLFLACCLFPLFLSDALAQNNEVSLTVGGGSFTDGDKSVAASAFTVAYTRTIFKGLAVEGSWDGFFVRTPNLGSDGYEAFQIGAAYNFRSNAASRRIIPYISAGVGKVTTDFTEIPAEVVYRFGGGAKYYFKENSGWGIRVELRDEITSRGLQNYPLKGSRLSLVSLRAGVTYRF